KRGRVALGQRNPHLGKALAKGWNDLGQYIARLSVRAADDHPALVAMGEFVADLFKVVHLAHDALDDLRHHGARLGQPFDPLAMAFEYLDAQFVFALDNGLGHARLRAEEHTSELQSREKVVCRPLLQKKTN